MKELKDFRIDVLVNLYLKLNKDANCYALPSKKEKVWFKKSKGEIAGKLFSWIENEEGVFMMFKVNDDFSTIKPYTSYYIPLQSKQIEWSSVKTQLDTKRRSEMQFYDVWFEDLEKAVEDYENKLLDGLKTGLYWGAVLVIGVVGFKFLEAYVKAKFYGAVVREGLKEVKK
jgi:hypothetical protein